MKKILSLILSICILFSCAVTAFGESERQRNGEGALSPEYADNMVLLREIVWTERFFLAQVDIRHLTEKLSSCRITVSFDPEVIGLTDDVGLTDCVKDYEYTEDSLTFILDCEKLTKDINVLAELTFGVLEVEANVYTKLNVEVTECLDESGEDFCLDALCFGNGLYRTLNADQRTAYFLFNERYSAEGAMFRAPENIQEAYVPIAPGTTVKDIAALLENTMLKEVRMEKVLGEYSGAEEISYQVTAYNSIVPKAADDPVLEEDMLRVQFGGLPLIVRLFTYTGDVDHNGRIEVADARLALRAAVGLQILYSWGEGAVMELSANGKPDAATARAILRIAVGLDTQKPEGKAEREFLETKAAYFRIEVPNEEYFAKLSLPMRIDTYEEFLSFRQDVEKNDKTDGRMFYTDFFGTYDEEFFRTKSLVLNYCKEPSGGIVHRTAAVYKEGAKLTLVIQSLAPVGVGLTCDMAYWLCSEEIEDAILTGVTDFNTIFSILH